MLQVAPALHQSQDALLRAMGQLLMPLARLAIARGLPYAAADELLRGAFVRAALLAHPTLAQQRSVSRISTATGLNRREVSRLINADEPAGASKWLAGEVATRWLSDKDLAARPLRRQGAAPSFEALAQSVTRDVHPRSLLDELVRLRLASWDEELDMVELRREALVPRDDERRMMDFLGDNVGDHLSAAVDNVCGRTPQHLEQALFADELSEGSVEVLHKLLGERWQQMLEEFVPLLNRLIAEDAAAGRTQDRRVRVGLYGYSDSMN